MGVHSGKWGTINGVNTVGQWSVNDIQASQKFVASNTKGGAGRRAGVKDWNGSYNAWGELPAVLPGAAFTFDGYTAPDTEVYNDGGTIISGNAIVDSVAITYNWGTGAIISHVVNFSGNGPLTRDVDAAILDAASVVAPTVCAASILYADSDDFADYTALAAVEQVVLTITSENKSYANSDTNCWMQRKPGPIDFTLAVTQQDNYADLPAKDLFKGADYGIKFGTDFGVPLLRWELQYCHLKEVTGLTVNRETGDIIKRTLNFEMNGFPAGFPVGKILRPGSATAWWPLP